MDVMTSCLDPLERGAYLLIDDISLNPSQTKKWTIVANVNQTIDKYLFL